MTFLKMSELPAVTWLDGKFWSLLEWQSFIDYDYSGSAHNRSQDKSFTLTL